MDFELYTRKIIEALLIGYIDLENNDRTRELKMDLDEAFKSTAITNKMRLFIFLKYAMQFNMLDTMNIMQLSYVDYNELEDEIFETLEAILNGWRSTKEPLKSIQSTSYKDLLIEIETSHVHPFHFKKLDGIIEELASMNDDLALSAMRKVIDNREEYTDDISANSSYIKKEEPNSSKRNASNDEFYRTDLRHSIFYGDDALIIADIERNN